MSGSNPDRPTARVQPDGRVIDLRLQRIRHIDVGTPIDSRGVPDYSRFEEASQLTVAQAQTGELVLVSSSPYVGATQATVLPALDKRGFKPGADIFVAVWAGNTEFGVVGGSTRECTKRALSLLTDGVGSPAPAPSLEAAEMLGMAAGALAATREAAEWELNRLCVALRIPAEEVFALLELLPRDPGQAATLSWQARAILNMPVIDAAVAARRNRGRELLHLIREALADVGKSLAWSRVIVVPSGDDQFSAQVVDLARHAGAEVTVFELPMGPIDCDLILHLGEGEPHLTAGSMPIQLDSRGMLRDELEL